MEVGNRIYIDKNGCKLISFIEDIISDNSIVIQLPYVYQNEALLDDIDTYSITINTKDKIIDAVGKISGIKTTNRRKYYVLELLNLLYKENQKRKYERYFCNLHQKISLLHNYKEENINIILKDISLGGIRFLTNNSIECDSFKIKMILNDNYFVADSKIIQSQYYPKSNYKNQYRIKFENIENENLLKNYFDKLNYNSQILL